MRITALLALTLLLMTSGCGKPKAPAAASSKSLAAIPPKPGDAGYVAEDPQLLALVGRPAPDIILKTIDGQAIDLKSLYGSKPVYLKLWATYCGPCRLQMPGFNHIFGQYGKVMEIIAVDLGFGDDREKVRAFAQEAGMRMPLTIDDGSLAAWLKMDSTPVHLLIGRDGKVAFAGHQDGPILDAALKKALSEAVVIGPISLSKVDQTKTIVAGETVPDLNLVDAAGKPMLLKAAGTKPKVILFTSVWCESYLREYEPKKVATCKATREAVQRLASDTAFDWSVVVTNLWTTPADLPNFEKQLTPRLHVAMDTDGSAFAALGVRQFPAVALIQRDGRLARIVTSRDKDLAEAVNALKASP